MTLNLNKPFQLFANCIPVKGYNRSVICDLQRSTIKLIPNDLFSILNKYKGETINEIQRKFDNSYDSTIIEYFEFLLENEFIFFTEVPNLFLDLPLTWDHPSEITNCIVDFDKNSIHDIRAIIDELNHFRCTGLELRYYDSVKIKDIEKHLSYAETIESSIISIELLIPNYPELKIEMITDLFHNNPRLSAIKVFNAIKNELISPVRENSGYILLTKEDIQSNLHCGMISSDFFVASIPVFTEGQKFNTCLNRKIGIDSKGNIKNCPTMSKSFGNISNDSLKDVIYKKGFKKYWGVTKDSIDVCKDCEFRYICTDCRAFVKNKYDKPLKCGYNPYTNKWEDWSENSLKTI